MVKLDKITTKKGDSGNSYFGKTKISKKSEIFYILGEFDELNSSLGLALSFSDKSSNYFNKTLKDIQNKLFNIGAEVLTSNKLSKYKKKITKNEITDLEHKLSYFNMKLPHLNSFILPGGSKVSSALHIARSATRRIERNLVKIVTNTNNFHINKNIIIYFNRLSDLFFVMARFYNFKKKIKEDLWIS